MTHNIFSENQKLRNLNVIIDFITKPISYMVCACLIQNYIFFHLLCMLCKLGELYSHYFSSLLLTSFKMFHVLLNIFVLYFIGKIVVLFCILYIYVCLFFRLLSIDIHTV